MRQVLYYVSEAKGAHLDEVIDAISAPELIEDQGFSYTFIDSLTENGATFGRLVKFSKEGTTWVVQPPKRTTRKENIKNMLIASTPFVYLHDPEGKLAFQVIWDNFKPQHFSYLFRGLILASKPKSKLQLTPMRIAEEHPNARENLARLETIYDIDVVVRPPNPFSNRLWRDLRDYLEHRGVRETHIKESCERDQSLKTDLVKIDMLDDATEWSNTLEHADMAVLMALANCGFARIKGKERSGKDMVVVGGVRLRPFSFRYDHDPRPLQLIAAAKEALSNVADASPPPTPAPT